MVDKSLEELKWMYENYLTEGIFSEANKILKKISEQYPNGYDNNSFLEKKILKLQKKASKRLVNANDLAYLGVLYGFMGEYERASELYAQAKEIYPNLEVIFDEEYVRILTRIDPENKKVHEKVLLFIDFQKKFRKVSSKKRIFRENSEKKLFYYRPEKISVKETLNIWENFCDSMKISESVKELGPFAEGELEKLEAIPELELKKLIRLSEVRFEKMVESIIRDFVKKRALRKTALKKRAVNVSIFLIAWTITLLFYIEYLKGYYRFSNFQVGIALILMFFIIFTPIICLFHVLGGRD